MSNSPNPLQNIESKTLLNRSNLNSNTSMDEPSNKDVTKKLTDESKEYETQALSDDGEKKHFGPADKGNIVAIIFFIFGVGVLLAFNVCLNCLDFYEEKMKPHSP